METTITILTLAISILALISLYAIVKCQQTHKESKYNENFDAEKVKSTEGKAYTFIRDGKQYRIIIHKIYSTAKDNVVEADFYLIISGSEVDDNETYDVRKSTEPFFTTEIFEDTTFEIDYFAAIRLYRQIRYKDSYWNYQTKTEI